MWLNLAALGLFLTGSRCAFPVAISPGGDIDLKRGPGARLKRMSML